MYAAAFYSPPQSRAQQQRAIAASDKKVKNFSVKMLQSGVRQELPLDVHVDSAAIEDDHVVYSATMSNITTDKSWTVSYRYSEFLTFRGKIDELWTCRSSKCTGSCEAIRDYVSVCFPKKRIAFSSSSRVIADRKEKLELVLLHLLRCILLPGSAMKCFHARNKLPKHVFKFLGVKDRADRRSLLQIFVDNRQPNLRASTSDSELLDSFHSTASTWSTESTQCVICLEDVDCEHSHSSDDCESDDNDPIVLPCNHAFHRECIFEWLLFQFHCPLCRKRIGPSATTNYCRAKGQVQWWLGEFDENPLKPACN